MAGMTSHAQSKRIGTPGLGAAWAVLVGTGVTSVTYNVVHATQGARLEIVLALLLGFAPAFVAACLSHVAAVLDAPGWVKAAVIAVMGAGMVLSASATAAVVAPADPSWRGWLFGGTLDAAALLALWAILTARGRKNEAAMAVEAAHEAVQNARAEVAEAVGERDAARAELASVRADLEAEVQGLRSALTDALNKALTQRRGSGRTRARSSAPAKPSGSVPRDVDTQAEALRILGEEPDISGQELGRRLGKSESYGCRLKNKLAAHIAGDET